MKQLLVIGKTWPEPQSTGAGWRMMQLLSCFKDYGFKISFGSAASKTAYSEDLDDFDITEIPLKLNSTSFDELLKTLKPEVVLFDRFMTEEQFGWRVAEQCPKTLRILNTEDLHCLRLARQNAYNAKRKFSKSDLFNDIAKREIASLLRCDLSLMISEAEITILKDVFNINERLLYYLPFLIEPSSKKNQDLLPVFDDRKDFVMIGNWLHKPNHASVSYVYDEVWPLIRKDLPDARIMVYGAYASKSAQQYHKPKNGFYIMGRATSAEEVLQKAKVLLSPILYGAGLKTKFIKAMQQGTPSITTTIGAEGIGGYLPFAGEIANDATVIAKEAVKHYTSKKQWHKAQQNGFNILEKRFSETMFKADFEEHVSILLDSIEAHRESNFIGQILQHHTLQSTKYMSRWIELKESKKD